MSIIPCDEMDCLGWTLPGNLDHTLSTSFSNSDSVTLVTDTIGALAELQVTCLRRLVCVLCARNGVCWSCLPDGAHLLGPFCVPTSILTKSDTMLQGVLSMEL